jgi:hypothetical protein
MLANCHVGEMSCWRVVNWRIVRAPNKRHNFFSWSRSRIKINKIFHFALLKPRNKSWSQNRIIFCSHSRSRKVTESASSGSVSLCFMKYGTVLLILIGSGKEEPWGSGSSYGGHLRNLHSDEAPALARKNMRLLAVPAPQHCLNQCYGAGAASFGRSQSRNAMRSRKPHQNFCPEPYKNYAAPQH